MSASSNRNSGRRIGQDHRLRSETHWDCVRRAQQSIRLVFYQPNGSRIHGYSQVFKKKTLRTVACGLKRVWRCTRKRQDGRSDPNGHWSGTETQQDGWSDLAGWSFAEMDTVKYYKKPRNRCHMRSQAGAAIMHQENARRTERSDRHRD